VVVEACHAFRAGTAVGRAFVHVCCANVTIDATLLLLIGLLVWVAGTTGLLTAALVRRQGCFFQDGRVTRVNERGGQARAKGQEQERGAGDCQGKRSEGGEDEEEAEGLEDKDAPRRDLQWVQGTFEAMPASGHWPGLPVYVCTQGHSMAWECRYGPLIHQQIIIAFDVSVGWMH
jgi:hypothetical protein